ncbi:MAG: MotA/TolQ/ExbB proton channel family protein [Opitutae bacterium]|nr:MotA/TolQ/ExbB proton channel family protein [Opitutae bacterium]
MVLIITEIFRIWGSGGWVMIPLCLLAVLIYTTGFEMLLFLKAYNQGLDPNQNLQSWITNPEQAPKQAKEIIRYTQENVSSSKQLRSRFEEIEQTILHKIDRQLIFLNTLVASAPLMGLLGTVIGMLGTFSAISAGGGSETVDMVAAGISEALITTQTGLFIALPGLFLVLVIRRQKSSIKSAILRLESHSLTTLDLK